MGVYIKGATKEEVMLALMQSPYWLHDDVAMVEIKAPHGRLIDADELEEDDNWSEWEDGFTSYSRLQISTQPTVIESEVE